MEKNKLEIMWQVVDGSQSVHWAAAKWGNWEKNYYISAFEFLLQS